jgi:hypothetical protein
VSRTSECLNANPNQQSAMIPLILASRCSNRGQLSASTLCWIASSKQDVLGVELSVAIQQMEKIECKRLGCVCLWLLPSGWLLMFRRKKDLLVVLVVVMQAVGPQKRDAQSNLVKLVRKGAALEIKPA